jgi:hypothetical protein
MLDAVMPKTSSFDLVKESRNVGRDGRAALLLFEAVGFAASANLRLRMPRCVVS